MQKSHWATLVAVVVLIIFGFIIARSLYFGGATNPYSPPQVELSNVSLEQAQVSARNAIEDVPETTADGIVLVDFAHNNALFVEELNTLFSKLVARGLQYEIIPPEDAEAENDVTLVDRLKYADALISPLPRQNFTPEEQTEIERFVENGGRVLIIGDPTRTIEVNALNSIAGSFGIIYANDYLYSLNEDSIDNNYRNVVYANFGDSPLTEGLSADDKVIFFSGGSVNAPGHEIILGDEYTRSSTSESDHTMAAAALTTNDQVLALGDLTFFNDPYNAAESNGVFINNIADFLSAGERSYELRDFPHYFGTNVDVVFDNTRVFNSQFEDSVKLKDLLEANNSQVSFTDSINTENDVIYVGRLGETEAVQEYLDAAGIVILEPIIEDEEPDEILVSDSTQTDENAPAAAGEVAPPAELDEDADADFVEGRIQIEGVGELERGGSTLFYLHKDGNRNILIVLSDNPDTNADAFKLLMDDELSTCTVGPAVAVCQTESPDKQELPSIRSTRIDKVLVVSDNEGRPRLDDQTSAVEYRNALSDTYKITTWTTSREDRPTLNELQEYDAVVWSTGDYWDDSLDSGDAELLTQYIEEGGNLILSGASIAFDWDHSEFLETIVHADYLTFAELGDIEVANDEHPISKGLTLGEVIPLTVTVPAADEDPLTPDVINHTPDARVIFQRGPDSDQAGAPTIIAYEDDRSKIAYFAFPVYQLPADARTPLLINTFDWFTRKPLDFPKESDYEPFETDESGNIVDDSDETPTDEETPDEGEAPPEDDESEEPPADPADDNDESGEEGEDQENTDENTETEG